MAGDTLVINFYIDMPEKSTIYLKREWKCLKYHILYFLLGCFICYILRIWCVCRIRSGTSWIPPKARSTTSSISSLSSWTWGTRPWESGTTTDLSMVSLAFLSGVLTGTTLCAAPSPRLHPPLGPAVTFISQRANNALRQHKHLTDLSQPNVSYANHQYFSRVNFSISHICITSPLSPPYSALIQRQVSQEVDGNNVTSSHFCDDIVSSIISGVN